MDLGGWDFVSAVDIDAVNSRLLSAKSELVTDFSLTGAVVASGIYDNWQIAPGGADELIVLALTLGQGSLQQGGSTVPLSGGVLTIKVALALLSGQRGQTLQFSFSPQTVTFMGLTGISGLGEIAAAALGNALAADLCARAGEIQFVLASVIAPGATGPTWLNPVSLAFAYAAPTSGKPMLGIFALTHAGDISGLDRDLDPGIIGAGNVGLAISPALFMTQVLAPALAEALGVPVSSLVVSGNSSLANNGPIPLPAVSKSGQTFHPSITALSAVLSDDHVALQLEGKCDMHMNITMSFTASSSIGVSLGTGSSLALSTIGTPQFSHSENVPWYDHLLDLLGGVAEVILDTTVAVLSSKLGDGISHVSGTSQLVAQAPSIVGWVGTTGFTPAAASLDDALLLQGSVA